MKLTNKEYNDPKIELMDMNTTVALNEYMKKNSKL